MPANYNTAESNLQSLNFGYGRENQEWYGHLSDALQDPIGWFRGRILGDDKARTQQDMINNLNRQWALEDWYRAAEYNSPANQRRLFEQAGFNPHLALGSSSSVMGQGSTPAGSVANTSDGKLAKAMGVMEGFLRLKSGFAALREQDLKNRFLEQSLDSRVAGVELKNQLSAAQTLSNTERADAVRITNQYMHTLLAQRIRGNDQQLDMQNFRNSIETFNYHTGIFEAVAELKSYGMSDSDIERCLHASGLDASWYRSSGLAEWNAAERKVDIAERNAAISEADMSKALSSIGIHEGDPLYTRLMAVAQGASGDAVTAAAVSDKILQSAMQIFGTVNSAVGNAVRNGYVRRMTQRAGFIDMGNTTHRIGGSVERSSRYLDLSTGELVGGF